MMLKILLMPVKLLAIPLAMVLYTLHVLGSMVAGLASIPAGLMTLVLLLAGIQSAWHHEWFNVGMAFVVEVCLVTVQLVVFLLVDKLADWATAVVAFVFT